jgi:hypothetical protein
MYRPGRINLLIFRAETFLIPNSGYEDAMTGLGAFPFGVLAFPLAVIVSAAKQSLTINVWDSRGKKFFALTSVVALLAMTAYGLAMTALTACLSSFIFDL